MAGGAFAWCSFTLSFNRFASGEMDSLVGEMLPLVFRLNKDESGDENSIKSIKTHGRVLQKLRSYQTRVLTQSCSVPALPFSLFYNTVRNAMRFIKLRYLYFCGSTFVKRWSPNKRPGLKVSLELILFYKIAFCLSLFSRSPLDKIHATLKSRTPADVLPLNGKTSAGGLIFSSTWGGPLLSEGLSGSAAWEGKRTNNEIVEIPSPVSDNDEVCRYRKLNKKTGFRRGAWLMLHVSSPQGRALRYDIR